MATNRRRYTSNILRVTVPSPTESSDPVICGDMAGIALTNYDDRDGKATVAFNGVYDVSVKAVAGGGNSAVVEGDPLYYVDGDSPPVSKKATGVFIGFALEGVSSGQTGTINVRLADGGPNTADDAVAAAMFVSIEQTGNGSEQSVTHGLGRTPTKVLVVPTEFASNLNVDIAEGTHTGTAVLVTVTSGVKYKVMAV